MIEKRVLSLSYGRIVIKPEDKLHGLVPESFETYQIVNPGDIIIRSTDLQNDWTSLRVGLVRNRGIITSAYLCLKMVGLLVPEYGYLQLHAFDLMKVFYGMGSGLRQNLDFSDFKRMPVLAPPHEEQTAIVRFLGHANRRIERYIRAKKKLIALLNEQKQAIIHRAVTRGLDPHVRLKPSGIPWLGDIPEHWKVWPLRRCISIQSGDFMDGAKLKNERTDSSPIPVIGGNGIMGFANQSNVSRLTIVIGRVGALCGNVHLVKEAAWITDNALRITRIEGFDPGYLAEQLRVMNLNLLANANAQPLVTGGIIKAQRVVKPPQPEQQSIIDEVQRLSDPVTTAISRLERETELLREYRTRLVADVVTGKLDVREVANQLPEEAAEIKAAPDAEELSEPEPEEAEA
ncbi:MAG TPA: restriction endonuclease subunit S [Candidatus Binatia bacterium]